MKYPIKYFILALICTLTGFNQELTFAAKIKESSKVQEIVFIPKSTDQAFWRLMKSGVDDALKENHEIHLTWRGPSYNDDTDAQIQILKHYTSKEIKAIIISPTDMKQLVKPIDEAAQLGIKIIIVDSGYSGNMHEAFISTNNYESGRDAADRMAKILNKKGSVALIRTVLGSGSTDNRAKGFIDKIIKDYPGIHIKYDIYAGGTTGKIFHYLSDYFTRERINENKIDGVFAVNESSSEGVLMALDKLNLSGKIKVVGFDYTDFLREKLISGELDSVFIQDPKTMGFLSMKTAINVINGGKVKEKNIYTKTVMMTLDNMNSESVNRVVSIK